MALLSRALFCWLLTDTIGLKSIVELILLSVWRHIFVADGTMFDKCSRRTYCLYSTILIIFALSWFLWSAYSLVRYLKCQVLWMLMKTKSGEHLECFRGMVLQMLEALLSSKIVSRGSSLWPPSITIIDKRNLLTMTRVGLPGLSSLILIPLSAFLWDSRTWEHR